MKPFPRPMLEKKTDYEVQVLAVKLPRVLIDYFHFVATGLKITFDECILRALCGDITGDFEIVGEDAMQTMFKDTEKLREVIKKITGSAPELY